jgi:hypothetical protein
MTGPEHYSAAERLLQPRTVHSIPLGEAREAPPTTDMILQALAHATLALAAATAVPSDADTEDAAWRAVAGPAAGYDWRRYERTCAPDRQVDGLGDLALFLGGDETSFTGELLKLVAKAQSTPERFAALAAAFPREVTAWRVWMACPAPVTAAALCATLTSLAPER